MAYAQQPRYGGPQRQPHQDHRPSYESPREPYAAKNGYRSRSQAAHFNGNPRRGLPQGYQNSNEPLGGSYAYIEDWPDHDNSYDGGNGRYGGKGQNRGGRWSPAQRLQERPVEAGRHLHHDPRSRGLPLSKPAPPGTSNFHPQEPYLHSNQYREPQSYEQHYQPEGMYYNGLLEQKHGECGYDEFSLEVPGNWTATQHHDGPHSDDQAYQDAEHTAGYTPQDRGDSYDKESSLGSYRNNRSPRQPEAPASRFKQNQPNSTRPQNPQHPKPCKSAKSVREGADVCMEMPADH